ncbi:MAG: hypothetical protein R6W31_15750 [Bacteroidales bacterium]
MGYLEDAVKVFRLNIGFFPNSAFCYDSMSDAYIKTGENDLAIKCTEKAIELLPNDMDLSAGYKIKLEEILQTKLKEINKLQDRVEVLFLIISRIYAVLGLNENGVVCLKKSMQEGRMSEFGNFIRDWDLASLRGFKPYRELLNLEKE